MTLTWGLIILIEGAGLFDTGYRFSDFESCVNSKAEARYTVSARQHIPRLEEEVVSNGLICVPMAKRNNE